MKPILIELPLEMYRAVINHLLRPNSKVEQAAFGYADIVTEDGRTIFRVRKWQPVPPEGLEVQTAYHIELNDEMKASVIKRAHDLGACLVEFHSHTGRRPAAFSGSDRLGFLEFVPHILWRLKGRPYVAVVVSRSGLDAVTWSNDVQTPQRVEALHAGDQVLPCSGLTPLSMDDDYE